MMVIRRAAPIAAALVLLFAGLRAHGQDTAQTQAAPSMSATAPAGAIWLDSLDVSRATQGWGRPHAGRSVDGNPLTIAGAVYPHGFGTHSPGSLRIELHGAATRFVSMVGIDDETAGRGSAVFDVVVDGKVAARSSVLRARDAAQLISADLTGARILTLRVTGAGDGDSYDHAVWAGAYIQLAPGGRQPETAAVAQDPPRLAYVRVDPRPAIHGPRIVGASPGRSFLFLIPATGDGPLTYSAAGLPPGLVLNSQTGVISGALRSAGRTTAHLTVQGPKGSARRDLTIVGGVRTLALTPPMGWNSWNVWAGEVNDARVRAAADELMATGLAAHGFQYVNIDDTWEAGRDSAGRIQTNAKFPDMKGLGDYIHGKGLRFGIYSSPGRTTCAGYTASYQHEDLDAQSYADWGVDYLKYDWCSYGAIARGSDLAILRKPYAVMRASLDKVDRDIVYSLCQYGMGAVWTWGADGDIGGNCWRTHGDIQDIWGSLRDIIETEPGHEKYAGPGHWNDPDMLMVGVVGFGNTHPTRLTPNEQITHISMWCMLSSPLLIGCDMTRLDKFTTALLSNDEALDIDQDPLGRAASPVAKDGDSEVWARPLFDGTHAVALVNMGDDAAPITVRWKDAGVSGRQPVRDLWLHKDVGRYRDSYTVDVPAHGTVLLRIGRGTAR